LILGLSLCLSWQAVECGCGRWTQASWKSSLQGPKVTQPKSTDPTKVLVDWRGMIKNPECLDGFYIKYWRKDIDSMNAQAKTTSRIFKNTFSSVVENIDPCMDYYFSVEFEVKPSLSRPFKVKGGKAIFKTTASPALVSTNPTNVRVEYMYRILTDDFDMTRAVLKFNKNQVVKYPNCLGSIQLKLTETSSTLRRNKRTIGQVYQNPLTPSRPPTSTSSSVSRSSYGSSSSSSSRSSYGTTTISSATTLRPPFRGQNDDIELTFKVKPCAQYNIQMEFYGQRSSQLVGKVDNIRMKSLAEMPNLRLPPITKVLSVLPMVVSPKIQVRFSSPIPASCLQSYLEAVDIKLKQTAGSVSSSNCNRPSIDPAANNPTRPSILVPDAQAINPILKGHGCVCSNTSMVNLTSTDSRVLSKHKPELGAYKFEGQLHEGKPYYVRRTGVSSYYIYYVPKVKSWYLAKQLNSTSPLLKLDKNAATSCPENPTTKKWQRKNAFGIWGADKSMKLTCDKKLVMLTPRPSQDSGPTFPSSGTTNPILNNHGCMCKDTSMVNVTSTDSRVLSKHKLQLGAYKFEGNLHQGKPYYVRKTGVSFYYIYYEPKVKSWYLAKKLNSTSPLLKLEKNAATSCPENPTTKKWQRKNAFGIWGADKSMRLTCGATKDSATSRPSYVTTTARSTYRPTYPTSRPTSRPSYTTPRPTYRPTYTTKRPVVTTTRPRTTVNPLSAKLKTAGCQCHKVSTVTVSSTDSRTKRKHKDALGRYSFLGTMFKGKPVYERTVGSKTYYMYYFLVKKGWWIGETIGGSNPLMKTGDQTDQACPADPTTPRSQSWKRKNAFGFWGKDTTMIVKCL